MHPQVSLSSKDGLRGIISGSAATVCSQLIQVRVALKLPFHFQLGCNRVMLRVHPSAVCLLNKDSLFDFHLLKAPD